MAIELSKGPPTPSIYKMNIKSKEEDLVNLLPTMPCWHIDERSHQLANVNIQTFILLKG
jgi:hypothetical protein